LSTALKGEARRRSDAGEFFGHIAYASLIRAEAGVGSIATDEIGAGNGDASRDVAAMRALERHGDISVCVSCACLTPAVP